MLQIIIYIYIQEERRKRESLQFRLNLIYSMPTGIFIEFLNHNVVFLDDFSENMKKNYIINNFKLL